MAIGSIFGGYFSEKFGRRSTHSMSSLPLSAGWLLIYFAANTKLILIGRFLTGLCCGMLATCTGVYIGETSEPQYRGFLLGGISLAVSLGWYRLLMKVRFSILVMISSSINKTLCISRQILFVLHLYFQCNVLQIFVCHESINIL